MSRHCGDVRTRCGGYVVRVHRNRVTVRCAVCGPSGRFTPRAARRLAGKLLGVLARFETNALPAERRRLARLLYSAASRASVSRETY